ncbi:MAG: DegT/DnrJ/EryC1/StrS family aminotransferase [Acidobacteria bacterium Pan2503]|uniref:DegT/DnrJ/EryC1/StrS family aminotransferase n=1 Tax=Candidatus Acidiferrum panamense TaxID=2741543 RepID=A0A7V8NQ39_9BACT|nr:DegT/DnrJ/EryC1/StrS family aminotransferase [Candidatus Acidoferrum panamensis]
MSHPQANPRSEPIPQFDLSDQYAAVGAEIRTAIDRVLSSQQFVLGREGAAFEEEIAVLCGVAHGVGVASGTEALILALRACGVQAGDEVLLPTYTFVATGSAVSALGAKPVFVDIRPETYNLDPVELERRVTSRTRAIIAVHLYGLAADMDPILAFAKSRKLPLIEDCAQAIGALYKGRRAGSFGDAACFSFYPTKNLGAYGDAGMIVSNSAELAAHLGTLRNHGQTTMYRSSEPGWNSRLDEIQAAVLRVKLRHLAEWQGTRRSHAAEYTRLLRQVPGVMPPHEPEGLEHVYHQYTIRTEQRDALQRHLAARRIGTTVYYPYPLHLQPLYAQLGHRAGAFPHAERAAQEVLSLPMYPELRKDQIAHVVEAIAEFLKC